MIEWEREKWHKVIADSTNENETHTKLLSVNTKLMRYTVSTW